MSHVRSAQKESNFVLPTAGETYVAEDGTVSHVLEDVIDANYEPTHEEIVEYAEWIGMRLPEDGDLLWIAKDGLKTPLPKEWKPCKTDDGEVYYFNFRTGESSWSHPMDDVIRQRFETEKARRQQTAAGIKGPGITSNSTMGAGAASTVASHSIDIHSKSASVTAAALSVPNSAGLLGAPGGNVGSSGSSNSPELRQPPFALSPGPTRILSEAERKLEAQIRQEMEKDFDAERQKAETHYAATIASLRKLLDKDVADAKEADAQRRAASTSDMEEERRRRVSEARMRCDDRYGAQLRELERQAENVKAQLAKLDAEEKRVLEQLSSESAAAEAEAAAALETELNRVEGDVAETKKKQLNLMSSAFVTEKAALEKSVAEASTRAREAMERDARQREVEAAKNTEARRLQLEEEQRRLSEELRAAKARGGNANAGSSGDPDTSNDSAPSLAKRLAAIAARRDATCAEVRAQAVRAQAALRKGKEAERQALRTAIREASEAAAKANRHESSQHQRTPASSGPPTPGVTPKPSFHTNGTGDGAAAAAADGGGTFLQRISALRARYAKEKVEMMGQLTKEREARLAEVKNSAVSTPVALTPSGIGSSNSSFSKVPTQQEETTIELHGADAAVAAAREAAFAAVERDWAAAMAKALTTASESPAGAEAALTAAVDADMQVFTIRTNARRDRERHVLELRRDKMLADHAAAVAAREAKIAATAAQREADMKEVKKAMLEDAVAELIEKEKASLERDGTAVRTRRTSHFVREEEVLKEEVEEELSAYLNAEMTAAQRAAATTAAPSFTASTGPSAATTTPTAAAVAGPAMVARTATREAERDRLTACIEALARREKEQEGRQADEAAAVDAELRAGKEEEQRCEREGSRLEARAEGEQVAAVAKSAAKSTASAIRKTHNQATVGPTAPTTRVRLVAPPNSVAKTTHAARMAALEANYVAQESSLRQELDELQRTIAAAALPQQASSLSSLQQGQQPHQQSQQRTTGMATPPAVEPSPVPHASPPLLYSSAAVRLWAQQRDDMRRRHEVLSSVREAYQAEAYAGTGTPVMRQASATTSPPPSLPYPPFTLHPMPTASGAAAAASAPIPIPLVPAEPRLMAAVETLNRTLGVLSSRVAVLEGSREGEGHSDSYSENQKRSQRHSSSHGHSHHLPASAKGSKVGGQRGSHPSGLPQSPPRRGARTGRGEREGSHSLLRKWDRSLLAYSSEGSLL